MQRSILELMPTSVIIGCCLPTLGASVTFGLDNPVGTQAPGSIPFLVFAFAPDPSFPCGTQIPGFGMSAPGAAGELLIDLAPPAAVGSPRWQHGATQATTEGATPPLR